MEVKNWKRIVSDKMKNGRGGQIRKQMVGKKEA